MLDLFQNFLACLRYQYFLPMLIFYNKNQGFHYIAVGSLQILYCITVRKAGPFPQDVYFFEIKLMPIVLEYSSYAMGRS